MSVQFTANDCLYIGNGGTPNAPNYNAAFTVCCWVRPEDTNTWRGILNVAYDDNNENSLTLNGSGHFECENNNATSYTGTATSSLSYSANAWKFVAMRRLSTSVVDIYEDGTVTTGASASVVGRSASNTFGIAAWGTAAGLGGFVGRIAQVRAWTTNLSDAELVTEKNSTTAVKTASLWGEYRLIDATNKATDYSGNARTLTVVGSGMTTGADDPTQGGGGSAALTTNLGTGAPGSSVMAFSKRIG